MQQNDTEAPEFTDEQLRAALKRVSQEVRQTLFAAGYPLMVIKGRSIVALYEDGSEEIIESLSAPSWRRIRYRPRGHLP